MGYHIHAAFFFDGRRVLMDIAKAKAIGKLWERITDGWGYFHSCNHEKARYKERCGVGMFKHRDGTGKQNVISACHYLIEDGQSLRVKPVGAEHFALVVLVGATEQGSILIPLNDKSGISAALLVSGMN